MDSAIKKAVELAGGQSALARLVNVTPQAVQQWVACNRVSYKKTFDVERATGVPKEDLRPDLYIKKT